MKIAIITSLFGDIDYLKDPPIVFKGVDYHAFVEKKHDCKTWKQHISPNFSLDKSYSNRRNAKIYKAMPHLFLPDYDYWFWVDTTHAVMKNPFEICKDWLKDNDIVLFKHTTRKCAYKEAEEVRRLNIDYPYLIENQIKYYKSEGFPENFGLFELPVSIRKNTERIKILNLRWWEQICKYSSRDQISMPYVLWKTGITPTIMPGFSNGGLGANEFIPQVRHKGK